ncbi:MAG: formylglycine-generating enzyme family protein [Gemmataceae bacterium]|nr:formylglycine-generating enzyme family protein [Gemmataceae bacterium]
MVPVHCPDWPFDAQEAARRQKVLGEHRRTLDLGDGVRLELALIPAGRFVMGDATGHPDEGPPHPVQIKKPFWIGRFEITNEQFRRFEARHDSGLEDGDFLQFSEEERGYPVNGPRQPAVRISWRQAVQFCAWLSRRTGKRFTLPTEAQWEYACRAGTDSPLAYGRPGDDFSRWANLADAALRKVDLFGWGLPVGAIPPWRPADGHVNDGARVSAPVGSYLANAWGLHDLHGNVAEWTRSLEAPYPYADDGRNDSAAAGRRVVRGGSWSERPHRARSASRQSYWPYQRVYDVGFRVVCEP